MGFKEKVVTVAAVTALMTGAVTYLDPTPKTSEQQRKQQTEQQVSDLSDAQERELENRRRTGMDVGEANRLEKLKPVKVRPKIRVRVP